MLILYVVLALVITAGCVFAALTKFSLHVTATATVIAVALLAPWATYSVTAAIAKNMDQTYYEFWNGSEVATSVNVVPCEKDGFCENTYDCDPYTVYEPVTSTDSKGNTTTTMVAKTHYHSCPYSSEETDYIVSTTLGDFFAGEAWMTGAPYRAAEPIPGERKVSPPVTWLEAKARIEAGNPSGVTQLNPYKNFILSSDTTLFENYSDKVDSLAAESLLPIPANATHSLYMSEKVYNAGDTQVDLPSLNSQLKQLNGYVGSELRGDMHIVFADSSQVGNASDYTNALKAYWTSEMVGKYAIAKNTLTLVVGVVQEDGKPVVDWAKGFTGMPVGNERLLQEFSNLKGVAIDDNFIGSPKFVPAAGTYEMSGGAVENMVSGEHRFNRVSMSASDEGDTGSGFAYLSDSWQMKQPALTIAIVISSILSSITLIGGAFIARTLKDGWEDPLYKFWNMVYSK